MWHNDNESKRPGDGCIPGAPAEMGLGGICCNNKNTNKGLLMWVRLQKRYRRYATIAATPFAMWRRLVKGKTWMCMIKMCMNCSAVHVVAVQPHRQRELGPLKVVGLLTLARLMSML